MTVIDMDVPRTKRPAQCALRLDKATRDALADYCRQRWPHHTAKMAAREWDLTTDQGRSVVGSTCSFTLYDKIKKAGGWPVVLAVEAAVVGHGLDQFLARIGASNESHREQLAALVGGLWPGGPARLPDPADMDSGEDRRRRAVGR